MLKNLTIFSPTPGYKLDMFPVLTENNPERIISLTVSLTFSVISIPFLYGIILFERFGSDKKRTVINTFTTMICWTLIGLSVLVKIPETFRFIYGPLPETFCCFQNVNKYFIAPTIMLFYDAIAIARYVYIFCLKNPAALDDEFWGYFVSIWIYLTTVLLTLTVFFLAEYKNLGYFLCIGKISKELPETYTSKGMSIVLALSIIIHLATRIKIYIYKRKDNRVYIQSLRNSNKTAAIQQIETHSVSSYAANLFGMFITGLVIAFISMLNNVEMQDLNKYPNYVLVYFVYLISTNILLLFFLVASYHKETMRKFITEEFKDLFR